MRSFITPKQRALALNVLNESMNHAIPRLNELARTMGLRRTVDGTSLYKAEDKRVREILKNAEAIALAPVQSYFSVSKYAVWVFFKLRVDLDDRTCDYLEISHGVLETPEQGEYTFRRTDHTEEEVRNVVSKMEELRREYEALRTEHNRLATQYLMKDYTR